MMEQGGLDLIVVDYLGLMSSDRRQENRQQEVSDISRGLKAVALELKVPVLACAQLARANTQRRNKRPQLSDLRDSGSIEQDADVVLFIHREKYYQTDEAGGRAARGRRRRGGNHRVQAAQRPRRHRGSGVAGRVCPLHQSAWR